MPLEDEKEKTPYSVPYSSERPAKEEEKPKDGAVAGALSSSSTSSIGTEGDNIFCWNCGQKIEDPNKRWCDHCRAPLEEDAKMEILNRTMPVVSTRCWRCGATTSGNVCGTCGSPLTMQGLQEIKEYSSFVVPGTKESTDTVRVVSPKDRQVKEVHISMDELQDTIARHVTITQSEVNPSVGPIFIIQRPEKGSDAIRKLREEEIFENNNLRILIRNERVTPTSKEVVIRFFYWKGRTVKERRNWKKLSINLVLYLATFGTVALAGYFIFSATYEEYGVNANLGLDVFLYTISLMLILTVHELGHFFTSRLKGIDASLPYFIPVPSFPAFPTLGTFGALITQQEPHRTRDDLFDIGISGPIAGFVATIPIYLIGLSIMHVIPIPADSPEGQGMPFIVVESLLSNFGLVTGIVPSFDPFTQTLVQHPMMFAAWVGFLLTGINLMPASQLDGGHTIRAAFGELPHRILTFAAALILVLNEYTMVFGFLVFLMGMRGHPGPGDDVTPINWKRYILLGLGFLLLLICFPIPNQIYNLFIDEPAELTITGLL